MLNAFRKLCPKSPSPDRSGHRVQLIGDPDLQVARARVPDAERRDPAHSEEHPPPGAARFASQARLDAEGRRDPGGEEAVPGPGVQDEAVGPAIVDRGRDDDQRPAGGGELERNDGAHC